MTSQKTAKSHRGSASVSWQDRDGALAQAKSQRKPLYVFLGSASSSETWAMEKESFVDGEIARLLNEDFVPLRVKQECDPLLAEAVVMACGAMNASEEPPLNLFATPDLKPFFAASYMPRRGNPNRPGLGECLPRIKWLWLTENESVLLAAEETMESLRRSSDEGGGLPGRDSLCLAAKEILDAACGKNKLPTVPELLFMGEFVKVVRDRRCEEAFRRFLDAMAQSLPSEAFEDPADRALASVALAEGFGRFGSEVCKKAVESAFSCDDPKAGAARRRDGLTAASLARCGRLLDRPDYVAEAEKICESAGSSGSVLDDYAFSLWGCLEVYGSTGRAKWLDRALELEQTVTGLFGLEKGYSLSKEDGPGILFRRVRGRDGRRPSGASVMAGNLVSLWILTGDGAYLNRALDTVRASGGAAGKNPRAYPLLLTALLRTMA